MAEREGGAFETRTLSAEPDATAPDGSAIRLLPTLPGASMVHCSLPPGGVSKAVAHRTVEEIWYVLAGRGEVWRQQGNREEVARVEPGMGLTLPLGTCFQFRALGPEPLELIIVTLPPWPGGDEAYRVADHWPTGE